MAPCGRRCPIALFRSLSTSSALKYVSIAHPTTRRLNASTTAARYSTPSPVGMYLMSASHSWSGARRLCGKSGGPRTYGARAFGTRIPAVRKAEWIVLRKCCSQRYSSGLLDP